MEIKYGGAHRSGNFEVLIKEAPSLASVDANGFMVLELGTIRIDRMSGEYNVQVILSSEDIGKIVAEFYKKAINKK